MHPILISLGSFIAAIGTFFVFIQIGHTPNITPALLSLLSTALFIFGTFSLVRIFR
ncbi:MAG: hypothetical protein FWD06_03210 [Oscillospiraceae bacterium]|nr:hypothetical protein [Oscillospiraceae bacterium]